MKIILEGIDNCGKSTFARKIVEKNPGMNYKIFHCTKETANNLSFFENLLESDENIIFDRFHVGQWVYQSAEERINNHWLTMRGLTILENKMEKMIKNGDLRIIYVSSPIEHCARECRRSADDSHMTLDYLTDLDKKYRFFFNNISSIGNLTEFYNTGISVTLDDTDFSKLPKIVGIDFDGVLCYSNFPELGKPNYTVYNYIMENYKDWKKVLWTSRTNGHLKEALNFCEKYFPELKFDAVNDNIDEVKVMTADNTRKLYCDVLIDDCALQGVEEVGIKKYPKVR